MCSHPNVPIPFCKNYMLQYFTCELEMCEQNNWRKHNPTSFGVTALEVIKKWVLGFFRGWGFGN